MDRSIFLKERCELNVLKVHVSSIIMVVILSMLIISPDFVYGFATNADASLVLGQTDFISSSADGGGTVAANVLEAPRDVAFDSAGNLWVAEEGNDRVVRYSKPFSTGQAADLVIGQPNLTSEGNSVSSTRLDNPTGIAFDSTGNLWVADTTNHRVLRFDTPFTTGQTASLVLGQPNLNSNTANNGGLDAGSLSRPRDLAFDSAGNLWIVDKDNSRVVRYDAPFTSATDDAEIILGQADATSGTKNRDNTDDAKNNSFDNPEYLALDSSDNLWIGDSLNHRLVRYNSPFTTFTDTADVVLGQPDFTSETANQGAIGANTVENVRAIAIESDGDIWLSDRGNHRVLRYDAPFTDGEAATIALGQADFTGQTANQGAGVAAANYLNVPTGLALDSGGNLWVADLSNNRVLCYGITCPNSSSSTSPSSSNRDSSAPTLGTSSTGQRLIENGFVYNDNPIDVENFKTHYPLVRTPVGEKNTLDLKVLENQGMNAIWFVSVHFGVPQINQQGEAMITYYPGTGMIKIHDPNNLLGDVDITMDPVKCKTSDTNEKCVNFSIDHSFNEAPIHDVVRVTLADKTRNSANVFFNDGIEVYGDSLNPPATTQIAAQGKDRGMIHLVQTDRATDLWSDEDENQWTRNIMGSWIKLTQEDYVLPDDNIIGVNGIKRMNQHFAQYTYDQELLAYQVWDNTLIQSEIQDYIPSVVITETLRSNDPILQAEIIYQIQLAQQQWNSQTIQGVMNDYISTRYTTQEYGVTNADLRIEMQKADQLLEELYYLTKINENGAIIQKSPIISYKGMTNAKLSDEYIQDAKLSENDKARQLLYELYGLE